MEKETVINETENVETAQAPVEKPKKSELVKEMKELEEQYKNLFSTFLNKEFSVVVGTRKNFNRLRKFVESQMPVSYLSCVNAELLLKNIQQQSDFTKLPDWNGEILLNTTSCQVLMRAIQEWKGNGAYEAREMLELLMTNKTWESLTRHLKTINDDQESMRGLHTRLSEIDNILENPEAYENDMPDVETESLNKQEEKVAEAVKEELNPEV